MFTAIYAFGYRNYRFQIFVYSYKARSVIYYLCTMIQPRKKRLVIFASGKGSNAAKIIEHFAGNAAGEVVAVGSNKSDAPVLSLAQNAGIETFSFDQQALEDGRVLSKLKSLEADYIILAGFLKKIPGSLIQAYPSHIVNIHPALLPKFGGPGMYGMRVHEAVKAAGERVTGITIHLVNEAYDEGARLFQARVGIAPNDSAEDIAAAVLQLEHRFFPQVIEALCKV